MMPGVGQHNMGNWQGGSPVGAVSGYPSSSGPPVFDGLPLGTARMYRNSPLTTTAGSWQIIPFDTIQYDTLGRCNLTTRSYNVPSAGLYLVVVGFLFGTIPAANSLAIQISTFNQGVVSQAMGVQSGVAGQELGAIATDMVQAGQSLPDNITAYYFTTYAGSPLLGS